MKRLRLRAARHGVFMEEEVRQILRRSVLAPERLGDVADQIFSSTYGTEAFVLPTREHCGPVTFE